MPMLTVAMKPWCKQAREAELGSRSEAERLGTVPVSRPERLVGAMFPSVAVATKVVRES